jgi:hypothetical protein
MASGWSLNVSATTMLGNIPDDVEYAGETYLSAELGSTFTCQPDQGCVGAR